MKFSTFIFSMLFAVCAITTSFSQDSLSQGDVLVGVNSDLSQTALSDLALNSNVLYGVSDDIFIGGTVSGVNDQVSFGLNTRGYFFDVSDLEGFGQVSYTYPDADSDFISVGVGLTKRFNDWLFVEPSFQYNFTDDSTYGLNIGFGLIL